MDKLWANLGVAWTAAGERHHPDNSGRNVKPGSRSALNRKAAL